MVSGDDHHPGARDCGKQVVDLLQIPGQRLTVEQISRDQKKIRMAVPGILDDGLEGETDGLLPLFSPGPVAVTNQIPNSIYEERRHCLNSIALQQQINIFLREVISSISKRIAPYDTLII